MELDVEEVVEGLDLGVEEVEEVDLDVEEVMSSLEVEGSDRSGCFFFEVNKPERGRLDRLSEGGISLGEPVEERGRDLG